MCKRTRAIVESKGRLSGAASKALGNTHAAFLVRAPLGVTGMHAATAPHAYERRTPTDDDVEGQL